MTSEAIGDDTAYVWFWLPGAQHPVLAGRLDRERDVLVFTYGRTYLAHPAAVSIFLPELALRRGPQLPLVGTVAGCLRDAGPDSWGQRVVENRHGGIGPADGPGLLTYLLESGSNGIGALDFRRTPEAYVGAEPTPSTLDELLDSAARVEAGIPLSIDLDRALLHGTSIGGARPKALLVDGQRELIAKFSSTTDTDPLVRFEFVGMELARRCGIEVPPVELVTALARDVLLVERFDRPGGGARRMVVSALTILGLDEYGARYASYADLADQVRARFSEPAATLRELFARIVFNVIIGNTDDHARNHAAFWDGDALTLTPAYDISPWVRRGGEASHAMSFDRAGTKDSRLQACVNAAGIYRLTGTEARTLIDAQIDIVSSAFEDVCDLAELSPTDIRKLRHGAVLHPSILYGY